MSAFVHRWGNSLQHVVHSCVIALTWRPQQEEAGARWGGWVAIACRGLPISAVSSPVKTLNLDTQDGHVLMCRAWARRGGQVWGGGGVYVKIKHYKSQFQKILSVIWTNKHLISKLGHFPCSLTDKHTYSPAYAIFSEANLTTESNTM